jgi:DNA-binding CsgD family transcriptional regulator
MNMKGGLSMSEVIVHIDELVFILDRDFRIVECSGSVDRRFPGAVNGLRNRPFSEILSLDKAYAEKAALLSAGKIRNFSLPMSFTVGKEFCPVRVYITELKDQFGDYSGFLALANEEKGVDQFRKRFGLTKRELEIIRLIVSGVTYKGISEQLDISEKTVERHLTNIYNKVGISNKISLFRLPANMDSSRNNPPAMAEKTRIPIGIRESGKSYSDV